MGVSRKGSCSILLDPHGSVSISILLLDPPGPCWILLDLVYLLDLLDLLNLLDPAGSWWMLLDPAGSCWVLQNPAGFCRFFLLDPGGSCWIILGPLDPGGYCCWHCIASSLQHHHVESTEGAFKFLPFPATGGGVNL